MSLVYRVQDREGRGPWRPGFSRLWVEDRDDHDNLIPWPTQFGFEIIPKSDGHLGCGCKTKEQLQRWFTPTEYTTLHSYGFTAVQMEVDRVLAESDIQLVFQRTKPLRKDVLAFDLYAERVALREGLAA
jgi:hypothetical protein